MVPTLAEPASGARRSVMFAPAKRAVAAKVVVGAGEGGVVEGDGVGVVVGVVVTTGGVPPPVAVPVPGTDPVGALLSGVAPAVPLAEAEGSAGSALTSARAGRAETARMPLKVMAVANPITRNRDRCVIACPPPRYRSMIG
ncbi:hypothetical protein [Galactobacter valiniphilus]|uniref:hypothetical protein n=1 Tax=Galactobacter valiniphilus TaxID=2676122 RepID=UPI00373676F3